MAAITTPIEKHPAAGEVSIEDFFGQNIDQMNEQQLQEFDRASEEIMKASRKRSSEAAAVGVAHETAR
jgi:23S rRNA U2552 (ribose-2'-O)-methylase RlmE/FtsJ